MKKTIKEKDIPKVYVDAEYIKMAVTIRERRVIDVRINNGRLQKEVCTIFSNGTVEREWLYLDSVNE